MQEGSSVFSLIFFLSALVSLFWGGHVIRLKPQRNINRAFLALSMALSIWSFGFAMANSQQSLDVALVWRRFSAIGWTSVFSLIVHFLLLLTSQKKDRKRDRSLFLLHIPAVIMMIVFAFSNQMAKLQYNLVKFDYGWINIAVNNGWDYAYYFYYVLYMIWGLVIIWKWKRIVSEKTKTSQGNLIFASIMAAAVFGSFTDLVSSSFLANPLPQMAPLFMFFPIGAMYYSIRYYDLINHNKLPDKGLIVSEADKQKIFYSIAIIFVVSGIFSFIFEYNLLVNTFEANFSLGFFKSVMFVVTGISIYLIQAIKNTKIRELMTIIVLVIHIPIITFQFLDYSGITVWAFPIIIIITSLVFRKKTLLISTGIVTIITQRLIWILKPEEAVVVDKYDYMLRIIILAGAVLVAYYVNKIYIAKIEENDYQIAFQKMDSDISFDFIGLNQDNFNDNVNHFLMRVATFFEGDRSYLFTINHQKGTMTYSNEWCASGIDPETRFLEEVAIDAYPWWIGQAQKNKPICIENTANMPSQARLEQEQFLRRQVKSVVLIPVLGGDEVQGFIGVDSIKAPKKWLSEDIKRLKIMGNLLASGMTQIKSDQEIEFMAYYDQLTGLPNRFLFADRVKQAIKLSQRTGKFIAVIFIDLDNFKSVNDTIGHKGGFTLIELVVVIAILGILMAIAIPKLGGFRDTANKRADKANERILRSAAEMHLADLGLPDAVGTFTEGGTNSAGALDEYISEDWPKPSTGGTYSVVIDNTGKIEVNVVGATQPGDD